VQVRFVGILTSVTFTRLIIRSFFSMGGRSPCAAT
jgi:hypothetical protein